MRYTVRLKDTAKEMTVNAVNELGAKVRYCEKRGFNYRVFARMLEVTPKGKSPTGKTFIRSH